ncbi:MAG: MarR family winged helix-turn-helix transcriptional regulator [Gemmatimonadota bacterium]
MNDATAAHRASVSSESGQTLALKLWTVLSRARSAVAKHSLADIERHGLTPGEFGALEALHHKGPLLLGELKEKILVSSGGITYLVDRLSDKGLAERRPCEEDRRASYAVLTEEGKSLMQRIFPEHARAIERAVSGLDDDEKAEAVRLLKKLGLRAAELDPV